MEAEILNIQQTTPAPAVTEDEAYWQHHTESQRSSGLSKSAYCQEHQVHYDRFIYWSRKLVTADPLTKMNSLVKVQLKESGLPLPHSILCTLTLNKGMCLQIHDQRALVVILERLG